MQSNSIPSKILRMLSLGEEQWTDYDCSGPDSPVRRPDDDLESDESFSSPEPVSPSGSSARFGDWAPNGKMPELPNLSPRSVVEEGLDAQGSSTSSWMCIYDLDSLCIPSNSFSSLDPSQMFYGGSVSSGSGLLPYMVDLFGSDPELEEEKRDDTESSQDDNQPIHDFLHPLHQPVEEEASTSSRTRRRFRSRKSRTKIGGQFNRCVLVESCCEAIPEVREKEEIEAIYLRVRRSTAINVKLHMPHLTHFRLCPSLQQQQQQQQQAPPPESEANKARAPRVQQSMSLAPAAAQTIAAQASKEPAPRRKEAGRPASVGSNGDMEKVQVQTPGADRSALKDLPALRDAPPTKREELFVMKLKLCSVIFSFDDPTADKRGKDMKRQTLLELVDYVNTPAGQKIFTESVMGDLMAMVSANVCRALPPATDDFDPEEDEPVLEPAWPHLQVAYEFFLRFIVSSEVNAKAAKKYVDQKFCLQLVELFDSEDPRERDYLKTILHRIYGKFMSHRSFIRRAISNVFYRFVYETERHNGIGELLEILGSIINGFAIPLKKEHLQFLVRALIPLHKPKCVALYHQQLSYCIIQYVEKDADTATPILNGFFKCWPWSCSGKQVMFLNELEEILELLGADQLAQVSTMLFTNLARCLDSDHFQVVERALFLWNNEHLVNSGCLSRLNAQTVLPIIYGPLYKNSSGHWNATVEGLAQNVLKMYMEYDLALYDKCTAAYFREEEEAKKKLEALNEKWHAIEQMAAQQHPALMAM